MGSLLLNYFQFEQNKRLKEKATEIVDQKKKLSAKTEEIKELNQLVLTIKKDSASIADQNKLLSTKFDSLKGIKTKEKKPLTISNK